MKHWFFFLPTGSPRWVSHDQLIFRVHVSTLKERSKHSKTQWKWNNDGKQSSIMKCGPDPLAERMVSGSSTWSQLFDTKKWSPAKSIFWKSPINKQIDPEKCPCVLWILWKAWKISITEPPALMPFRVLSSPKIKFLGQKTTPKKKVQAESLRHKSKLLVILLLYLHKSHSPSTSKQIFAEFVNGVLGGMVFVGPNTFTFHLSFGGTGCPGE